jgi:hypothetical protein
VRTSASLSLLLVLAGTPAGAITPAEMAPFRQTTNDIQAVGAAMMSWLSAQISAPVPRTAAPSSGAVDVTAYTPISRADLEARLVPLYIGAVPELDGWGYPYEYYLADDFPSAQVMLIRSAGADGKLEGPVYSPGDVTSFDQDLVWADGSFVRGPGPSLRDLRSRQVSERALVRDVGTAMMSWLTDQISFASTSAAATSTSTPIVFDLASYPPMSASDLAGRLVPQYIPRVPAVDEWGWPIDYYLDAGPTWGQHVMALRTRGRDGVAEGSTYAQATFSAGDLAADTVWADGLFVRSPDDLSALVFLDDFESGDGRFWSADAP